MMRLELVKRPEVSRVMMVGSPLIAVGLTVLVAAAVFAAQGHNPLNGVYLFFLEPLTSLWGVEQLILKATPRSPGTATRWTPTPTTSPS
ncbi:hypothetical protein SD80_019600 [Scytonema tolypothrichoides VB-61278]|nr:hypothetical protein SD80_019600 [Scytonema tolypothrichoides VB-61278]